MSNRFVINGEFIDAPAGLRVVNFVDDPANQPHFKHKPRKHKLTHFVLHETAGNSAKRCKLTLVKKGYGVHLIMARNGLISCHGDLATDRMVHANQLNNISIGIEIVNPYAPINAAGIKVQTIPAQWWTWCPDKKDRRYVLPTSFQMNALRILVPWLCDILGIPYVFPTEYLNKHLRKIKGWRKPPLGWRAKPGPGVVAHSDFSKHSDGVFLRECLIKNT